MKYNGVECSFGPCHKQAKAKGLCHAHYTQQWRGKELHEPRVRISYPILPGGRKNCTSCERLLDAEKDFYKRSNGSIQSWCKDCMLKYNREYQARIKEQQS